MSGSQYFDQDSPGISGESEYADGFGYALAAGDFDGDGPVAGHSELNRPQQ